MKKEPKDRLDLIIEQAIREKMDSIDISEDEIEQEWLRLQESLQFDNKNKKKALKYKKIAIIAASIILSLFLIKPIIDKGILARKPSTVENRIERNDDDIVIQNSSSLISDDENKEADTNNSMRMSIEEAREIVNFKFKELPYSLNHLVVTELGNDNYDIELNYKNDKGKIRFIQLMEGIDTKRSIGVPQDSEIETIDLNGTKYTIIEIVNKKTKVIWSSFGINYTLDIKYTISRDEVVSIIRAIN